MQTGLKISANEYAGHPSSWQIHTCWLIACLCWREQWFGWVVEESTAAKYSFIVKKACQVFGVCLRLSYKAPHHWQPSLIPLPFAVLLSDNVSWIMFEQWSGIIFLHLSYDTPHSSAVLKYKLKRQESSKAFPYISVWFQTEIKDRGVRYIHMSPDIPACLKYIWCKLHIFLSKCPSGMQRKLLFPTVWFQLGMLKRQTSFLLSTREKNKKNCQIFTNLHFVVFKKKREREKLNSHSQACCKIFRIFRTICNFLDNISSLETISVFTAWAVKHQRNEIFTNS